MFIKQEIQLQLKMFYYKNKQNLLDDKQQQEYKKLLLDYELLEASKLTLQNVKSNKTKELLKLRIDSESKIQSFLDNHKSQELKETISILIQNDKSSCIVGGAIRDVLISKSPQDIDFVSSLEYSKLQELFIKKGFEIICEGKSFLVLMVIKNGFSAHIANFRKEDDYKDNRHPDKIQIADIYEDAKRRDFTINALYYNLSQKSLFDSTGRGLFDLAKKELVFTSANVLAQDYIRAWRLVKFAYRGFAPSKQTLKLVRRQFEKIYKNSNPMRVLKELEEIFKPNKN